MLNAKNMLFLYPFQEAPDLLVINNCGFANNATNISCSATTGNFGKCYQFTNSLRSYIQPDINPVYTRQTFTFCCWFRLDTINKRNTLFSAGDLTVTSAGATLHVDGILNRLRYDLSNIGGNAGATTLTTNTWYHVGLVVTAGSGAIYLNGVLDNTPDTKTHSVGSDTKFRIGGLTQLITGESTMWMDGRIERPVFFDIALTAENIKRVMMCKHPMAQV